MRSGEPPKRDEQPEHCIIRIWYMGSVYAATWAISSFSSKVINLGSDGPVLAAAVSRICVTIGPCLNISIGI